jgi:hypothetical protein
MARRDEDGYINLSDRKSNMIISGGENIYMRSHGRDYRRMVKKRSAVAPAFDAIN